MNCGLRLWSMKAQISTFIELSKSGRFNTMGSFEFLLWKRLICPPQIQFQCAKRNDLKEKEGLESESSENLSAAAPVRCTAVWWSLIPQSHNPFQRENYQTLLNLPSSTSSSSSSPKYDSISHFLLLSVKVRNTQAKERLDNQSVSQSAGHSWLSAHSISSLICASKSIIYYL